jgi:zinc D-Ala-D-Ala carboxypeptidase
MKKSIVLISVLIISFGFYHPNSLVMDLSTDFIMGKFKPSEELNFKLVPRKYTDKLGMYLQKEALTAFEKMADAAKKEGVSLKIISSTRNFDYQKRIWESKWVNQKPSLTDKEKAIKILEYSAMPGASRHHWGTDMDLNSLENAYFAKGAGKKVYEWMVAHAATYGFGQPYSAGRSGGYKEEKWHWSYLPLAKKYTAYAKSHLTNTLFSGFKGAHTAAEIDVLNNYVLMINE